MQDRRYSLSHARAADDRNGAINLANLPPELRTDGASKRVYADIRGAPFGIGLLVQVHRLADGQGNSSLLWRQGVIEHYEYSCGCGQSYPTDPLIGVRFPEGGLEEFWNEELSLSGNLRCK
jgi:hypothetical protein